MISTWLFWISTYLNNRIFITFIISILLLSLASISALANEALYFKEAKSHKEKKSISFVKETSQTFDIKYVLALADLNNDILDEYIIKPKNCPTDTMCTYNIVAFMEETPISLLSIKAKKIIIKDTHNYGVRDIIIYDNQMNDFKKSEYQWNPYSYFYEQKH